MRLFGPWPLAWLSIVLTATAGGHVGIAVADLAAGTLTPDQAAGAAVWVICAVAAVAAWGYADARGHR